MMFGAWGNPDHDEGIAIIHRALDAGINFIDTADVYSRGESEEIVGKALAGGTARQRHPRHQGPRHDGGRPQRVRQLPALDRARGREQPAAAAHRLDRPLPDPPPRVRHRHRRDARRAHRPGPRREGPLHRLLDVPAQPDRGGAMGGARARARALRVRAAAVLDARARGRERRAAHVPAPPDGRDPMEPAGRRVADRALPARPGRADLTPRRADSRALRHVDPRKPAQARGGRRAGQARRRGRDQPDRDGARVRHPPPGGHRRDHRPADDGAARVPAHARPTSSCPTRSWTGSTRSSRRASTSIRPTADGRTRTWSGAGALGV